jgi:hypothetical protein
MQAIDYLPRFESINRLKQDTSAIIRGKKWKITPPRAFPGTAQHQVIFKPCYRAKTYINEVINYWRSYLKIKKIVKGIIQ